jgi:hypothetical protein
MKSNESWLMSDIGDIILKKHIILTTPVQTISQRLQNKIALNYGEWFLHNYEGVNWFGNDDIEGNIGRKLTELILDSQIQEYIKYDKDVSNILKYETILQENGNYQINITIHTKDNEIIEI